MISNLKFKIKNLKLSEEEVRHVAKLAKLELTPPEMKKFQEQLSQVLDYVDILKKLDTQKIEPTSQVTGLENVFRHDEVGESLSSKEALLNAPRQADGLFLVEAILKK